MEGNQPKNKMLYVGGWQEDSREQGMVVRRRQESREGEEGREADVCWVSEMAQELG